MFEFILALLTSVRVFFRSRSETALEILALRQQIVVLKRKRLRPRLDQFDRLFWIILRCVWSRWAEVLVAVKPETVVDHSTIWRWCQQYGPELHRRLRSTPIQADDLAHGRDLRAGRRPLDVLVPCCRQPRGDRRFLPL